jgi:hypothetical protein
MNKNHHEIDGYGEGKSLTKPDAERLFRELLLLDIISETCQQNFAGFINTYVRVSRHLFRLDPPYSSWFLAAWK